MPEIRLGNIFAPPVGDHLRALGQGLGLGLHRAVTARGLKVGFWNSVQILVPGVVISIAIASVNGYALSYWRFRGSELFFTVPAVRRLHPLPGC